MNIKAIIFLTCLALLLYDADAGLFGGFCGKSENKKGKTKQAAPASRKASASKPASTKASSSRRASAPAQASAPVPAPASAKAPEPAPVTAPAPATASVPASTPASTPASSSVSTSALTPVSGQAPATPSSPIPAPGQPPILEIESGIFITSDQCTNVTYDPPLKYMHIGSNSEDITFENTGTVVEMKLNRDSNDPTIIGGPLNPVEDHKLKKIVIHWGARENSGSDIAINNIRYALQFKFEFVGSKTGGKAVVSFLYKASDDAPKKNPTFDQFLTAIDSIRVANDPKKFAHKISLLMLEVLDKYFFTYRDKNNVIYIVYRDTLFVTRNQAKRFHDLHSADQDPKPLINGNCRRPRRPKDPSQVYFVA